MFVCPYVCVKQNTTKREKNVRDEIKPRTVEIKWAELAYLCHKMIQYNILPKKEREKNTHIICVLFASCVSAAKYIKTALFPVCTCALRYSEQQRVKLCQHY